MTPTITRQSTVSFDIHNLICHQSSLEFYFTGKQGRDDDVNILKSLKLVDITPASLAILS